RLCHRRGAGAARDHRPQLFSLAGVLRARVRAGGQGRPRCLDLTRPALRRGLTEMLVRFPVYRGYSEPADAPFLAQAADAARTNGLPGDRWVIDWLHARLGEQRAAVTRFQQLTAPVAAKAVEDTAFYRHGPLLSRNDVGFDVERFGWSAADFHERMQQRRGEPPHFPAAAAAARPKRGGGVGGPARAFGGRARGM